MGTNTRQTTRSVHVGSAPTREHLLKVTRPRGSVLQGKVGRTRGAHPDVASSPDVQEGESGRAVSWAHSRFWEEEATIPQGASPRPRGLGPARGCHVRRHLPGEASMLSRRGFWVRGPHPGTLGSGWEGETPAGEGTRWAPCEERAGSAGGQVRFQPGR